jgi:hypothetical protein
MSARVGHICNIDPCPAFLCLCLLAPLPLLLALGLAPLAEAKVSTGQASGKRQHVVAAVDHQSAQAFCAVMLCALHVNRATCAYGPGYKTMITQVTNAMSSAKPLSEPLSASRALEDEKSQHSPEGDSVEIARK